jgi:hypothetical protein
MLAIVLVVGMLFLPIAATFGSSRAPSPPQVSPPTSGLHADSSGLPSNNGWITNDHHFLIFSYIVTFGTSFQVISNGSQVFSDSILLDIYSLVNVPQTITISSTERGNVQTQSTTVLPGVSDVITVNLAQDANWVWDKITVDFTSQYYQVAVPFSFLPSTSARSAGSIWSRWRSSPRPWSPWRSPCRSRSGSCERPSTRAPSRWSSGGM